MNKYNLFSLNIDKKNNVIIQPFGMYNSGVICYFNSAIQCLLSCNSFVDYVLNDFYSNDMLDVIKTFIKANGNTDDNKSRISYDLGLFNAFMSKIKNKFRKDINYENFGYNQEDCCEMITILLDVINDEFVYNLFRHVYKCKLFCIKCRKSKETKEDSGFIFNINKNLIDKNLIKTENVINRLDHNLTKYIRNNYSVCYGIECDNCKSTEIIKTSQLVSVPSIVLIAFNKYEEKYEYDYPLSLDFINNSVKKNKHIFKCVSTIHHNGTKNFGHYYSRCLRGDKWYEINDISVSNIEEDIILYEKKANVYVVAYHYIDTVLY